jgi:hypothetical protein
LLAVAVQLFGVQDAGPEDLPDRVRALLRDGLLPLGGRVAEDVVASRVRLFARINVGATEGLGNPTGAR